MQKENIESSIGCSHEIVVIDNSHNDLSIFQAYNKGVEMSHGEVLAFIHEDIIYRSIGWGAIVEHILSDESIGLLGVIGSHLMPDFPAYYSDSPYLSCCNADRDKNGLHVHNEGHWNEDGIADVAVVDGQQMYIPRRLFPSLHFDDHLFSGFHGYDMDISMQVQALGKRVVVCNHIESEHGWDERKWEDKGMTRPLYCAMEVFYGKWAHALPIMRGFTPPNLELSNILLLWKDSYLLRKTKESRSYRLGKRMLQPVKWLKK